MKIAIMTFHWATNYGAVLQAFALQNYLSKLGHIVEIIDYYPNKYKKNLLNAFRTKHLRAIPARIRELSKEKAISNFRSNTLKITHHFNHSKKLQIISEKFDCFICGSDQIWNPSFTQFGEGKPSFAYFLDFVPDNKIISSYAGSFGVSAYPEHLINAIGDNFRRFDFISVREKTAINIVKQCGINNACLVPDPTLLLNAEDYFPFLVQENHTKPYIFSYMLHGMKLSNNTELVQYLKDTKFDIITPDDYTVEQWLTAIYGAEMVITNSFHGIVFSILFKKKFIAITIDGSGMNDRIYTLLEFLGLSDRIYQGTTSVLESEINWNDVFSKLGDFQNSGYEYINKITNHKK